MQKYLPLFVFSLFLGNLFGQIDGEHQIGCSTIDMPMPFGHQKAYVKAMTEDRAKYRMNGDSVIIPVVIHNLHYNYTGYIEDKRIYQALQDVNDGLANRGMFYDSLGVDTGIRLCLATIDPNGNPTSGIVHKHHELGLYEDKMEEEGIFDTSIQWDTSSYMNIYLCEARSGIASFPWSDYESNYDGILIHSGEIGLEAGVDIWIHEIGHYLGLYHTFHFWGFSIEGCGNGNCMTGNDGVCDTPPDQISYSACLPFNSCSSDLLDEDDSPFTTDVVDMVENYMDGSPCRSRFTQGQVDRMHWAINTFRPKLIENIENRCDNCEPIFTAFDFIEDFGIVGKPYLFINKTETTDISFRWYIDGVLTSQEINFSYMSNEPGVKLVRLEAYSIGDDCEQVWSREKFIQFRCQSNSNQLIQPDYYETDSCYVLEKEGFDNLKWTWDGETSEDYPMLICVEEPGIAPLILEYTEGICVRKDTTWINVLDKTNKFRSYFTYQMRFHQDSFHRGQIMRMKRLASNSYLVSGYQGTSRDLLGDGGYKDSKRPNFIRYWQPEGDFLEELYITDPNDSLRTIFLLDALPDLEGNVYFAAYQKYKNVGGYQKRTNGVSILIGKINNTRDLEWSKRLQWSDYSSDQQAINILGQGFFNQDFVENYLFFRLNDSFYKLSKEGKVLNSKIIRPIPYSTYSDWIKFNRDVNYSEGNERIWFGGRAPRIFFSDYEQYTGGYSDTEKYGLIVGSMNKGFEDIKYTFYKSSTFASSDGGIEGHEQIIREHPSGNAIVYWKDSYPSTNNSILTHNVAMVNTEGEFIWQKEIQGRNRTTPHDSPYVKCLDNGDILVGMHLEGESADVAMFRFTKDGTILYYYYLPVEEDTSSGLYGSGTRIGPQANTLGEDGILMMDIVGMQLILRHLPLDSMYVCETIERETELATDPLTIVPTDDIASEPIHAWTEDIEIEVHRQILNGFVEVRCENRVPLEDYSLQIQDTIYNCPDNMTITLELCRKKSAITDTISLVQYPLSPLATITSPSDIREIVFEVGQTCIREEWTATIADHHFMVNTRLDYLTPYTLEASFFDAHEQLEFEYRNNYVLVEGDCQMVATSDIPTTNRLKVFPNPTSKTLHLQLKNGRMEQARLYTLMGQRLIEKAVKANQATLFLEGFSEGVYLLEVETNTGQRIWKKVLVQKG